MEIKTDISLQTKQVLSQVQMQSLNILSMSMTELEEFLQNEEIENPLVEYSSGRQEGELPVAYREYDRFYNGASREGDSRGAGELSRAWAAFWSMAARAMGSGGAGWACER